MSSTSNTLHLLSMKGLNMNWFAWRTHPTEVSRTQQQQDLGLVWEKKCSTLSWRLRKCVQRKIKDLYQVYVSAWRPGYDTALAVSHLGDSVQHEIRHHQHVVAELVACPNRKKPESVHPGKTAQLASTTFASWSSTNVIQEKKKNFGMLYHTDEVALQVLNF